MLEIGKYLQIKQELLQAQLRVVYRHQRKTVPPGQKLKRTSNNMPIFLRVIPHSHPHFPRMMEKML